MIRRINTLWKVVVVLLVTLGVLTWISFLSYRSYSDFESALANLYWQSDDATLGDSIFIEMGELESLSQSYLVKESLQDWQSYSSKAQSIQEKVNSLRIRSKNTELQDEADSLNRTFKRKMFVFENIIALKEEQARRNPNSGAMEAISETQNLVTRDSLFFPQTEVTTTTVARKEQPKLRVEEGSRGFLGGVFRRRKQEPPRLEIGVKSDVMTEKRREYDTSYFRKVDTLISTVKSALQRAESLRKQQVMELATQQLVLVASNQELHRQLRAISLSISKKEQEKRTEEKRRTLMEARSSFDKVLIFAIIGGSLALLLIFLVIRDIVVGDKRQKQLAAAKRKAEKLAGVKEKFLAEMSHEIRTPLNSIIGFSRQLDSKKLPYEERKKVRYLHSSGEYLRSLVDDILDFSKIEAGQLPLEKIGFSPESIIEESLADLEHLVAEKELELRNEIDPELKGLTLLGDPYRLKQILTNLVGNSLKFTKVGFVKVNACILNRGENSIRARFSVEDTGRGIRPDKLKSIFDAFQQENPGISRQYGGTGLGLAISQRLVQLQGGKMLVKSELGEGSIFSFVLEYELASKDEYGERGTPRPVEIDLSGKSLLMVDDDHHSHHLLKPSFKRWHLKVHSAYNGQRALEMARVYDYDYVILDLKMPGLNGLQVAKQLRGAKQTRPLIILSTAEVDVARRDAKQYQNVDATLLKPFQEYELAAALIDNGSISPPPKAKREKPNADNSYNLDSFRAYADFDDTTLISFLKSFIESNRESLAALNFYFDEGNDIEVGETAHKMRNTFGQLKAEAVLEQLSALERLINQKQPRRLIQERVRKTTSLANELFTKVKNEIESLQKTVQASSP